MSFEDTERCSHDDDDDDDDGHGEGDGDDELEASLKATYGHSGDHNAPASHNTLEAGLVRSVAGGCDGYRQSDTGNESASIKPCA